jgi:hypothetical protein
MSNVETYVVAASSMNTVISAIARRRFADKLAQYEKDIAAYDRDRKRRRQDEIEMPEDAYRVDSINRNGFLGAAIEEDFGKGRDAKPKRPLGYQVVRKVDGVTTVEFVKRPLPPRFLTWRYSPYDRDGSGYVSHASQHGMLANPSVNRDINPRRVEEYQQQMEAGRWCDLLSDPITITHEGHVVDGQHRLAALASVDWSTVENDPAFLVVFGVAPEEAILADTSTKRTARDQSTIAAKVLMGRAA